MDEIHAVKLQRQDPPSDKRHHRKTGVKALRLIRQECYLNHREHNSHLIVFRETHLKNVDVAAEQKPNRLKTLTDPQKILIYPGT